MYLLGNVIRTPRIKKGERHGNGYKWEVVSCTKGYCDPNVPKAEKSIQLLPGTKNRCFTGIEGLGCGYGGKWGRH